jgi:hypothetical protein
LRLKAVLGRDAVTHGLRPRPHPLRTERALHTRPRTRPTVRDRPDFTPLVGWCDLVGCDKEAKDWECAPEGATRTWRCSCARRKDGIRTLPGPLPDNPPLAHTVADHIRPATVLDAEARSIPFRTPILEGWGQLMLPHLPAQDVTRWLNSRLIEISSFRNSSATRY